MKRYLFSILPGCILAIAAPVIFYVANPENRIYISWYEIQRSEFFSLALFGVFYILAYFVTRKADPAGLIAAILVCGTFYLWQISLVVAFVVLIYIAILKITRRKIEFVSINSLLNVLGIVLAGFYGFQLLSFLGRVPSPDRQAFVQPVIASEVDRPSAGELPDIYYIILDGYGRADMLEDIYEYDNSAFIQALRERDFVVPEASRSNYAQTVLSLGSSLNMQYLDAMEDAMGDTSIWWPIEDTLHHSQVREFLEKKGYRTIFTASDFDYTDIQDGDEYIKPFPIMLNNFEAGFVRFTGLSLLEGMDRFISYPSYFTHRRLIQSGFDALAQIAPTPGPKFVFTHIIAPHPPFVFDATGNPVNPDYPFTMVDKMRVIMDIPTYKRSYVSQLQYINSEVITTVGAILANSRTPPVIVIQADHGPGLFLDSESASETCLYERFSILSAYYLPGKGSDPIPETITPVNAFRSIFNAYFSTEFAILPDKSFFSPSSHFYSFQDITDQIKPTCTLQNKP